LGLEQPNALLDVRNLTVNFPVRSQALVRRRIGSVHAVADVTFAISKGETLGLVGESGCGKSTLGRAVLRLVSATSGSVVFDGCELTSLNPEALRSLRRRMQIIFQDSYASLDPRMSVGALISEPLIVHGLRSGHQARVIELLSLVGLPAETAKRYPHELSGGQRQRVNIARALAVNPDFVVCDEPISAVDVSLQAAIINLLEDLQRQFSLTYLFISHDLAMVRHISDRIAVMYLGKIVELALRDQIFTDPQHPYTMALLSAVPIPDPEIEEIREKDRIVLTGELPSGINPPTGCAFAGRCPFTNEVAQVYGIDCGTVAPVLAVEDGHWVACHRHARSRSSDA
jgi:oligopeptide transport system ATP-binding protein